MNSVRVISERLSNSTNDVPVLTESTFSGSILDAEHNNEFIVHSVVFAFSPTVLVHPYFESDIILIPMISSDFAI